ncbi:MAG: hypothetical protein ACOYMY_06170 [Prochlorococcaceae cyanobacterium]
MVVPRRLQSHTVMLGPPLLLQIALTGVLVPWLNDHGRNGLLASNERLLLGDQMVRRSIDRPLPTALLLARRQRLEGLQQQLLKTSFHGCYQQSRDELLHVLTWLQSPGVPTWEQPQRYGRKVAMFRRNLDACRRSADGRV